MTREQAEYLAMVKRSSAKIESHEMVGKVLAIYLKPNLLCIVEPNGESTVCTVKKKNDKA